MNFLQRIAAFFRGSGGGPSNRYLTVYVLSRRCREPIAGQVDLLNELSLSDDDAYSYYARKVFHTSGAQRCFGQVEVTLHFDANKRIAHHDVQGGDWLTREEYEAELAAFQARSAAAGAQAANADDDSGDAPAAPPSNR